jgi:hypothetical protein
MLGEGMVVPSRVNWLGNVSASRGKPYPLNETLWPAWPELGATTSVGGIVGVAVGVAVGVSVGSTRIIKALWLAAAGHAACSTAIPASTTAAKRSVAKRRILFRESLPCDELVKSE